MRSLLKDAAEPRDRLRLEPGCQLPLSRRLPPSRLPHDRCSPAACCIDSTLFSILDSVPLYTSNSVNSGAISSSGGAWERRRELHEMHELLCNLPVRCTHLTGPKPGAAANSKLTSSVAKYSPATAASSSAGPPAGTVTAAAFPSGRVVAELREHDQTSHGQSSGF